MIIETERLLLKPMKLEHLKLYIENYSRLCYSLGMSEKNKQVSEFMKKVFGIKINNIKSDPENWLYHTYFLIIEKKSMVECGLIGLKGKKTQDNFIEVGYGVDEEFRQKGFMTEALNRFCEKFLEKKLLSGIKAKVKKDNVASLNVLNKSGFGKISENDEFFEYLRT